MKWLRWADRTLPVQSMTLRLLITVALVHGWVLVSASTLGAHYGASDVLLYRDWMDQARSQGTWPVLDYPWAYPVLALLPMSVGLPVAGAGSMPYLMLWTVLVFAANAAAVCALLAHGRRNGTGSAAAWLWVTFPLCLGATSIFRLDGIAACLLLGGLLVWMTRPALAGLLFAFGAGVKVFPGVALLAVLVVGRGTQRVRVVASGAALGLLTAVVVTMVGGGRFLLSFLTFQQDRGLQVESPLAMPFLVAQKFGNSGISHAWDSQTLSVQVYGPGVQAVAAWASPLLAVAVIALSALLVRHHRAHHDLQGTVILACLALPVALILFNKVGSPQYLIWLLPAVCVGLLREPKVWRLPATLLLIAALAAQAVYPLAYDLFLDGHPLGLLFGTVKVILISGLLAWALRQCCRRPSTRPEVVPDGREPLSLVA